MLYHTPGEPTPRSAPARWVSSGASNIEVRWRLGPGGRESSMRRMDSPGSWLAAGRVHRAKYLGERCWLRGRTRALIAFILCGALGLGTAYSSLAAVASTTVVSVSGSQPWVDTGIDIAGGTEVSITATGIIHVAGSDTFGKSPAGAPGCIATGDDSIPPGPFIAPGLTCWSLVGRLGTDGEPFEVANAVQFLASTGGRLYLSINDNYFGDNVGSWDATVAVRPVGLLAPVSNGVTVEVVHGYNSPAYGSGSRLPNCKIGSSLDHCANQQFGLDLQPGPGWDNLILAPADGTPSQPVKGFGGDCLNFRLDDGTNLNICHFKSVSATAGVHVEQGRVLGVSAKQPIHISLDARNTAEPCAGGWNLPRKGTGSYYCPIQFMAQYNLEFVNLPWDGHQENQWDNMSFVSTNVEIP